MATVGATRAAGLFVAMCAIMSPAVLATGATKSVDVREESLCNALDSIGPGDQRDVIVSGIFATGPESRVLYAVDCLKNVQPVTWVEFSVDTPGANLLEQARREGRSASVLLKGMLYGPLRPLVVSDLKDLLRLQLLRSGQRYGHLNGFRTKLVVTEVLRAAAVPSDLRTDIVPFWTPPAVQILPPVLDGDIPRYPELARSLDITGRVELHVEAADGGVVEVSVKEGHPALVEEALRVVRTWKFAKEAKATFDSVFCFQLEARSLTANQNPRVEMQLPSSIKVTAVRSTW